MTEPDHLPAGRETSPQPEPATTRTKLTRLQKTLIFIVIGGVTVIAGIGFAGSYNAVTQLAVQKHFGAFSYAFPIGVDAGILAFLALDLLLTWFRIPKALARHIAWVLTAATIVFNATAAWGDRTAVGMHAVIPFLFVGAVEIGRFAIGRLADITADQHIESPPPIRWLLSPLSTWRIWRRMRLWHLTSYQGVITREREMQVFTAQLRTDHGRRWRRAAPAEKLLALKLAKVGIPIGEALALPTKEAIARQAQAAEAQAQVDAIEKQKRDAEAEAEKQRRDAEAEAEATRLELLASAAEKLAEAERQASRAAQEREQAETAARLAAEAREVAERRLKSRRDQETETAGTEKPKAKRDRIETDNVTELGDRETETARLLALMRDRKDHMKVSLDEAIRETGRPKSTAAKRLAAARDLYLAETA